VDGEGCCSPIRLHRPSCKISSYYHELDRLNSLSLPRGTGLSRFALLLLLFFLLLCTNSLAQAPQAEGRKLLHGSVFTAQGQPAAQAVVEIRDLQGMKVASGVTDNSGRFEISGAVKPGEYVLLVVSAFQIRAKQVRLEQADLELSLALPAAASNAVPTPERYVVSAKQLAVPAKAWTHFLAAQREFRKMKFDEAEREVDGALRVDPAFAQGLAMRAFIKLAEKDPDQAAEDARHAVSLDPRDAESSIALAMSYNSLGEFHAAEEAARYALSQRPDSWQGQLELAKSLYGQGDFVVALRELDLENIDFPDVHLMRGNMMIRLGRNQEAGEEFRAFLREAPNDPRGQQISRTVATLPPVNRDATASER
jgi:tetratricopeptide (TPR) repeat protein